MKKIFVSIFLLVLALCMVGCEKIVEYVVLSSIVKDENLSEAYIIYEDSNVRYEIGFNDLKEQDFYNNIMNSMAEQADVLPEVIPSWTIKFQSDNNDLIIENLCDELYAKYNENSYQIKCLSKDIVSLHDYLLGKEERMYKLEIQNNCAYELVGINDEYKAGEEVEVKTIYAADIVTYVFLNGENIGYLNGANTLKFKMPEKDSVLCITYSNSIQLS